MGSDYGWADGWIGALSCGLKWRGMAVSEWLVVLPDDLKWGGRL